MTLQFLQLYIELSIIRLMLPRDASAEHGYEIACRLSVRLTVRLSVTFRYHDHIG